MQLSLRTFSDLVQGMAAAVQASAVQLLDLTVGSTLRAILEATGSIALWMQWLILQVLQMTRAATSNGPDLDSWMADFSLVRLPASSASGMVTFSRFNTSVPAIVPIGTLVRTADGTQTFEVVQDTAPSGWSQTQSAYVLGTGVAAIDIPVVAQTPGMCGNVQAAAVSVLATALSGVDSVLNAAGFGNGIDAESDTAFRLRFQSFVSTLPRATPLAVAHAISSVQQGLSYTIQENQTPSGAFQLGNFVIIADDGSGYPSSTLLSMIQQAVDMVRPVGSTFAVFAPTVTRVDISLTVSTVDWITKSVVTPLITSAITAYVNALPVGAPLPASRVAQITYMVSSNISNVTAILLNGQASDITVQPSGMIKTGTIVIS